MSTSTIPLIGGSANAHQTFEIQLGENLVEFNLNYVQSGQWELNLSISDEVIASGLMLEPNCDILQSHSNLDIGQLIFVGEDTTLDNLGISNTLTWVSPE